MLLFLLFVVVVVVVVLCHCCCSCSCCFASDALPPSPAVTTPQWWMIRPTYCVMFAAVAVVIAMPLLAHGFLVEFPGASLSVRSPRLARQSSVPRWFACKRLAVLVLPSDALPPSPAMTTPHWWMIRPTCILFAAVAAFVLVGIAAAAVAVRALVVPALAVSTHKPHENENVSQPLRFIALLSPGICR